MIELTSVESRLALFAEGIAGRFYHIKPTTEFNSRRLTLASDQAALTNDTLLPGALLSPFAEVILLARVSPFR